MIRCWWTFRPIAHRARHVAHGAGRAIRHHKAAVVATLVCAVTAAPLGYGVGQGSGWWGENYGRESTTGGAGTVYPPGATGDLSLVPGAFSNAVDRQFASNCCVGPLVDQQPTPVPEPSSLALFAAAVPLLLIIRRLAK